MLRTLLLISLAACGAATPVEKPVAARSAHVPRWCILHMEDAQGNLTFMLLDQGYAGFDKSRYPWQLNVKMNIVEQNRNGHPTNDEALVLNAEEDRIREGLAMTDVIFLGRATGRGRRDILFYVASPEKVNPVMEHLAASAKLRSWEFLMFEDPTWTPVADFLGATDQCVK